MEDPKKCNCYQACLKQIFQAIHKVTYYRALLRVKEICHFGFLWCLKINRFAY